MDFIYNVWKKKVPLPGTTITLRGDSLAARCSCFWINEWKVMLDAGLKGYFNPKFIFITHTHTDHIERLHSILTDICTKPIVYVPKGTAKFVARYLNSMSRLTSLCPYVVCKHCTLVEVEPRDEIELVINNSRFVVRVFQTDHTVNSIGYAFSEFRKRLKPEYADLKQDDCAALARAGTEINHEVELNILIYTGDTTGTIFDTDAIDWGSYAVIITECTFINIESDDVITLARNKKHNYSDNIVDLATRCPNTLFVLCHWSVRYKPDVITRYFEEIGMPNIMPWVNVY